MPRWSSRSASLEPVCFAAVSGHHHGRHRLGGHRGRPALGVVLAQGFAECRGDELVGARAPVAVDQADAAVGGIVDPAGADHPVGRGHGPRREGGQRDGRRGLLEVVAAVGVDRAAVGQTSETALSEVGGIAVEVFGAHRSHDDLHDQARGFCGEGLESPEEGYGGENECAFHGLVKMRAQIYEFISIHLRKYAASD